MSTNISDDFEKYGGSYLLSNNAYEDYVQGKQLIGRSDGQFMTPSNQMDSLLQNYPNNPREWESQLGLKEGSLGNADIRRVDVFNPNDYEPRLPTQNLSGANDKFIPGGKTPGGQDECVINQFPNPENNPSIGRITTVDASIKNAPTANSHNVITSKSTEMSSKRDANLTDFGLSADPHPQVNSSSTTQAISGGMM